MHNPITEQTILDQIFLEARTFYAWQNKPVEDSLLKEIYDLMKFGPTSANCSPLRIIFVKSESAKTKLKPCLAEGNIEKTMAAPVTAIFAYDTEFYEHLPFLFPHADAKSWFEGKTEFSHNTATLNSALQAGYFIIAARMKGLDCGPMSGFNTQQCNEVFFKNTPYKSFLLCNLGYGDSSNQYPRSPRFDFAKICDIQ